MRSLFCPFTKRLCQPNCMLFLKHAGADVINETPSNDGEGVCSIAALSSHLISENHIGGNYLTYFIEFELKEEDNG